MTYQFEGKTIREHLFALAPRANATFSQSLHPGIENVLGLRVPDLRDLARRIVKSGTWETYLATAGQEFMEERMLHGIVLSLVPVTDAEAYLSLVSTYVRRINSWSVCDVFSFAGGRTFLNNHRDRLWRYLNAWMSSTEEYEIRFGVVMTMQYFIDEEYILSLLDRYASLRHEGYYVRMAVAWAVAECFTRFPEVTRPLLETQRLPTWTHNKTIQKIRESRRIDAAVKEELKALRARKVDF